LESQLSRSQTTQVELMDRVKESEVASSTIRRQTKQISAMEEERRVLVEEVPKAQAFRSCVAY